MRKESNENEKNIKIWDHVEYGSHSWTKTLLKYYELKTVHDVWYEMGIYRAANYFGCTPWSISYLANRENWKRPATKAPAIYTGVLRGNLDPKDFNTLDFSMLPDKTDE